MSPAFYFRNGILCGQGVPSPFASTDWPIYIYRSLNENLINLILMPFILRIRCNHAILFAERTLKALFSRQVFLFCGINDLFISIYLWENRRETVKNSGMYVVIYCGTILIYFLVPDFDIAVEHVQLMLLLYFHYFIYKILSFLITILKKKISRINKTIL